MDISKCDIDGKFITNLLNGSLPFAIKKDDEHHLPSSVPSYYSFQQLLQLRLDHNPIGRIGFESIVKVLLGHQSSIQNTIEKQQQHTRRSHIIEELYLSHCCLGDEAMECLRVQGIHVQVESEGGDNDNNCHNTYSMLTECQLKVLDLSYNNITSEGMSFLAYSLQGREEIEKSTAYGNCCFPHLVEISLAGNNIGEKGVFALAQAFDMRNRYNNLHNIQVLAEEETGERNNKKNGGNVSSNGHAEVEPIRTLDISETNCGVNGAIAMIRSRQLKSLRLFNNNLGKPFQKRLDSIDCSTNAGVGVSSDTCAGAKTQMFAADASTGGAGAAIGGFKLIADSIQEDLHASSSMLEILDLSGNYGKESDVAELLRCFLPTTSASSLPQIVQEHEEKQEDWQKDEQDQLLKQPKLVLLVIGGNESGDGIERLVDEIQKIRPQLDIARDKKSKRS